MGKSLNFLTDTGADVTCVALSTAKRQGFLQRMRSSREHLTAFAGTRIRVAGILTASLEWGKKSVREKIYVVDGGSEVLSKRVCEHLDIVK